ncbi:MAG: plastocyanin/azurin family copper-binding protein [Pseudomonadota bacterium]
MRAAVMTLAALSATAVSAAGEGHVVHQHSDAMASTAAEMFQFEPRILVLEPGETVAFLNSVGSHTVLSQNGLWPEGVAKVDIRGRARAELSFDTPGLYGITCARHGRYGMVMLIAVGPEGLKAAAALDLDEVDASARAKDAYRSLADMLLAGRLD